MELRLQLMIFVFDGRTITITYSIESEKDLGEKPFPFGSPQVMGFDGGGVVRTLQKLERKYVGMTTMSGNSSKRLDVANVCGIWKRLS